MTIPEDPDSSLVGKRIRFLERHRRRLLEEDGLDPEAALGRGPAGITLHLRGLQDQRFSAAFADEVSLLELLAGALEIRGTIRAAIRQQAKQKARWQYRWPAAK